MNNAAAEHRTAEAERQEQQQQRQQELRYQASWHRGWSWFYFFIGIIGGARGFQRLSNLMYKVQLIIEGYDNDAPTDLEKLLADCKRLNAVVYPWFKKIENEYVCSITHELPLRPVFCNIDGKIYDLPAIVNWLQLNPKKTPYGKPIDRRVELIRERKTEENIINALQPSLYLHRVTKIQAMWRGIVVRKQNSTKNDLKVDESDASHLRFRHKAAPDS